MATTDARPAAHPTGSLSVREGIALARKQGKYRGRKKALSAEQVQQLRRRVQAGESKAALARELGISRETLYQYLERPE